MLETIIATSDASVAATSYSILDVLRVLVAIPVFLYASYSDIQSRRVSENVWAIPFAVAILLLGYEAHIGDLTATVVGALLSVVFIGGLSLMLYKFRVFYRADYVAFVVIALLFPWQPDLGQYPLHDLVTIVTVDSILSAETWGARFDEIFLYGMVELFGFAVFVNTAFAAFAYFLWNTAYNITHGTFTFRHPLRSTCARHVELKDLPNHYGQVVDPVDSDNPLIRGLKFIRNGLQGQSIAFFREYHQWYTNEQGVPRDINLTEHEDINLESFLSDHDDWEPTGDIEEDKQVIENILSQDTVWITPGVPFIVPITFGLFTALLFGNLVFMFILLFS